MTRDNLSLFFNFLLFSVSFNESSNLFQKPRDFFCGLKNCNLWKELLSLLWRNRGNLFTALKNIYFFVCFSPTLHRSYLQKMWNDDGSLQRPAVSYDIWQFHTDCMTLPDVIWRCHISIWRCRMSKWRCKATFWRQPGYLDARLSAHMTEPLEKKTRSRSRLEKKLGAGATTKLASSSALWEDKKHKEIVL